MPGYLLHGLRIESFVELPSDRLDFASPDVVIRQGSVDAPDPGHLRDLRWFNAIRDEVGLVQKDVGALLVRGGKEVLVAPAQGGSEAKIQEILTGPAMVFLLQQRGLLPLHASASLMNGAAAVFPGHSGSGKSVLAAALCADGHPILSDDFVALRTNGNGIHVYPGSSSIRLRREALGLLAHAELAEERNWFPSQNKLVAHPERVCPEGQIAIKAFYVQEDGPEEAIEPLPHGEALIQVLRHTYANELYVELEGRGAHLTKSSDIAVRSRFFRLIRRRGVAPLPNLLRMLKEHYHQL